MLKKRLNFKHIIQLGTYFSTSMGETNVGKSKENPNELSYHKQTTAHFGLRQNGVFVTSDIYLFPVVTDFRWTCA